MLPFQGPNTARLINQNTLFVGLILSLLGLVWFMLPGSITASIQEAAAAMSFAEVLGTIASAICVYLAVKRNIWTYPIGIVGTVAFFFVFWNIGLYSSALLQVFFTAVQLYGWWYWLYGDKGNKPKITSINVYWVYGGLFAAFLMSGLLASITSRFGAAVPLTDAMIFGFSVVAQFFLDRKKLENWIVWFFVNAVSIYVYGTQGLYLITGLYIVFLLNAGYGYWEWLKEKRSYTPQ